MLSIGIILLLSFVAWRMVFAVFGASIWHAANLISQLKSVFS
jgi:hypothetical protein